MLISPKRLGAVCALLAPLLPAGCGDVHYRRIEIGQASEAYERILPADLSRRTELGLCYLDADGMGRTDAIVVLLSRDRRVAGKLHATLIERDYGMMSERRYRLRGVLDPELADLDAVGPIDMLRAVLSDLEHYRGEKLATDAHGWVAVGLTRMLQRWPHLRESTPGSGRFEQLLERVPAGGRASIVMTADGRFDLNYRVGN